MPPEQESPSLNNSYYSAPKGAAQTQAAMLRHQLRVPISPAVSVSTRKSLRIDNSITGSVTGAEAPKRVESSHKRNSINAAELTLPIPLDSASEDQGVDVSRIEEGVSGVEQDLTMFQMLADTHEANASMLLQEVHAMRVDLQQRERSIERRELASRMAGEEAQQRAQVVEMELESVYAALYTQRSLVSQARQDRQSMEAMLREQETQQREMLEYIHSLERIPGGKTIYCIEGPLGFLNDLNIGERFCHRTAYGMYNVQYVGTVGT